MNKTTPKDAFLHLGATFALYVSVISTLTLLFQYINYWLPDALLPFYGGGSIRWAIASIVVAFPAYIYVARLIYREGATEPAKYESRLRKWLMYLTLFIAALILAGDLIAVIYNFLEGELTARFILKAVAIGAVIGGAFYYLLWDLKRGSGAITPGAKQALTATVVAVALIVVYGFAIAGSPFEERLRRFDDRRVSDLQTIQRQVVNFYQAKGALPANLEELRDDISGFVPPVDPKTNEAYEYIPTGGLAFQLCATFEAKGDAAETERIAYPVFPGEKSESFAHGVGRTCFERTIDPAFYPVRK
jgi:hypothetical protein